MARKGYPDLAASDVEHDEGSVVWLYIYQLPEGELSLEVRWRRRNRSWSVQVWDFQLYET